MKDIRIPPKSLLSSSTRIKSYPRASVFEVKHPSIGYSKYLRKYNAKTRHVGVQIIEVINPRDAFYEGCVHPFGIPFKSLSCTTPIIEDKSQLNKLAALSKTKLTNCTFKIIQGTAVHISTMPQPTVSIIACFPPGFFLENIAAFKDGGLLVTAANQRQLYYVPPTMYQHQVAPLLLATFEPGQWAMGLQAAPQNPNVFYMLTSDMLGLGSHTCSLYVIDCSNPAAGPLPQKLFTFPTEAKGLNGLCALSESRLIAADSFGSCIWAVDLDITSFPPTAAKAKKWLAHDTMYGVLKLPDFQPGVNGLKYHARTSYVYYTSTQKRVFCRVSVDRETLEPADEPEVVAEGMPGDDLIIDDSSVDRPVAYVTTHRDNSILKVHLTDGSRLGKMEITLKGSMEVQNVLGPTAGVWAPGLEGKTAFFTSDGGLKNVLEDGAVRCAKVIKVDF